MARGKPIILDSFSWPTQTEALAAFQKILKGSGYNLHDSIKDPTHDLMLREVLERHPDRNEKIGEGVKHFLIGRPADDPTRRFPVKPTDTCIWIERVDGTRVDFSYETAVRKGTPKTDAKEALRSTVEAQRISYRDSRFAEQTPVISDLSGLPIFDRALGCVVYLNPTWGQLTFRFAETEGGWDKIKVHSGYGSVQIGGRFVDPAIESRWLAFHTKYGELGLATISEVARRTHVSDAAWDLSV